MKETGIRHMFKRDIKPTLDKAIKSFPAVILTGPRQSGKTTLIKGDFQKYNYFNLEFPDALSMIRSDPRGTINQYKDQGIIFDEAQRFPEIFSYIQGFIDESRQAGQFILSGSQNILLAKEVSQTLAGRAAWLELLPLTYSEYKTHPQIDIEKNLWRWLYHGTYPRPYQEDIDVNLWYQAYIRTYLERDVRDLLNVRDLSQYHNFIKLCAGRHGQLLNLSQLALDAGISHFTAKHWLSLLEASYIIFLLNPYFKNFSKRIIKTPKLYFYDSAIVCQLLAIDSPEHLSLHVSRGAIFEGYVITSIIKKFINSGLTPPIYFWRDSHGNEIDCLIERGNQLEGFEIKSTMTLRVDLFDSLKKWSTVSGTPLSCCKLIYAGDQTQKWLSTKAISWRDIDAEALG